MEQQYSVTVCGRHTGKVLVQRKGLYYSFSCRCSLADDIIYRLVVLSGNIQENLGILVPEKGSFVLNTKLPVKRIGEGNLSFILLPRQEKNLKTFVPISPEEPFSYISRLKKSFLILQDGQQGICLE